VRRTRKSIPSKKSTDVRQREIIDAAMRILTSDGARQFTAERLGKEVGLASGSIFRHFSSLEEILDGVVDRVEEIMFTAPLSRGDSPLETLRLFFEFRVLAIHEHPEVSRLLLTSILIPKGKKSTRDRRLREFRLRSRQIIRDCLKEAREEGSLSKGIHLEAATMLVLGAIYAIGHLPAGSNQGNIDSSLIRHIWHLLERSLTNGQQGVPK
jgi:AcrR family transcriptional regulator